MSAPSLHIESTDSMIYQPCSLVNGCFVQLMLIFMARSVLISEVSSFQGVKSTLLRSKICPLFQTGDSTSLLHYSIPA